MTRKVCLVELNGVTQIQLVASSRVTLAIVFPDFDCTRRTPELSDISRAPKVVALFREALGRSFPRLANAAGITRGKQGNMVRGNACNAIVGENSAHPFTSSMTKTAV